MFTCSKCCGANADVGQVFKVGVADAGDDDDKAAPAAGGYGRGRGGAGRRSLRSKSVGMQFKESPADLMGTISVTQPRYCIFYSFCTVSGFVMFLFFCLFFGPADAGRCEVCYWAEACLERWR